VALTLAWGPLRRKRISRRTVLNLPWHLALFGTLIGAVVPGERHEARGLCGIANGTLLASASATGLVGLALTGREPTSEELWSFQVLLGLLLSNGPGTISARGTKGAASADGPESPERVQLNKAYPGFLSHTGFSHGGNGFEGMQLLLDQFGGLDLADPGAEDHGQDLAALARRYALAYRQDPTARTRCCGARPRPKGHGPSRASTTRCSAASP
jgi:hypothetical protein